VAGAVIKSFTTQWATHLLWTRSEATILRVGISKELPICLINFPSIQAYVAGHEIPELVLQFLIKLNMYNKINFFFNFTYVY